MDVVTVKGFRVSPAKEADRAVLLRPAPRPQGREIGLLALSLVLVTLLHYGVEAALEATLGQNAEDVGHLAVVLYLVPLAWASVMFGPRQLLLIGLAVFAVNVPSLVLHHLRGLSWLFEATLLGTLLLVAAVLAWRNRAAAQEREDGLRLVVQRVTAAQEEERRRIAQELHDDTMQGLVIVRRELESLLGEPELHGSFRQKVEELEEATKRLADGLRRFSRDLRPSILDDLGLMPAIEWVVEDLHHRTGLLVHTSVLGEAPHRSGGAAQHREARTRATSSSGDCLQPRVHTSLRSRRRRRLFYAGLVERPSASGQAGPLGAWGAVCPDRRQARDHISSGQGHHRVR